MSDKENHDLYTNCINQTSPWHVLHVDFEYAQGQRGTDQLYMIWSKINKNGEVTRTAIGSSFSPPEKYTLWVQYINKPFHENDCSILMITISAMAFQMLLHSLSSVTTAAEALQL